MNPMEKAWSLLKANPDMTDTHGNTVDPAAMRYAQRARALEDSLQTVDERVLGRVRLAGRVSEREGVADQDMRDEEGAADFREALKDPRFARKKVGGETMQEHHDFSTRRSKDDVHEFMGYEHPLGREDMYFGPDGNIERMPRPEEKFPSSTANMQPVVEPPKFRVNQTTGSVERI